MSYRYLVNHYLEDSADGTPDKVAVVDGERTITYGELEARANQVANLLIDLGVRRGDRVGIFLRKSMESVIGIYGAMKAGACYVPLDPGRPRRPHRLHRRELRHPPPGDRDREAPLWAALQDEGADQLAHLVVLNAADTAALPPVDGMTAWAADTVDRQPTDLPDAGTVQQDLAYILYTSGSTGTPKGVMLTHLDCLAFVDWAAEEFSVSPRTDVEPRPAPLRPVHVRSLRRRDGGAPSCSSRPRSRCSRSRSPLHRPDGITVWYSVPVDPHMLVDRGELSSGRSASLQRILFAGEVFPTKYLPPADGAAAARPVREPVRSHRDRTSAPGTTSGASGEV